jgi:uncharacterized protein YbjT (DUF2867 family)
MSTILVTGGTGTLGQPVVARLREQGDEVRVLSRRSGAGTHVGDLKTGAGVAEAARGAELVVHAASDTPFGRADFKQTAHLLDVAGDAEHLLYVSIVGIDQIPFPYYKRKLACEHLITSSGIPSTILRATQFHELIASVARAVERLPLALLPLDFRFQTVAAAEVAERVADLIGGQPAGGILNFGGPEVLSLEHMAKAWKAARGRPRRMLRLPLMGKVARGFREGRNTCPEQAFGRQSWGEFVAQGRALPSPRTAETLRRT